jgi:uncharacterized delta-60 repeat protein
MKKGVLCLAISLVAACGSVSENKPDAPPAGDFSVAVTPSPVRIVQGMSEPATVTLTRSGFTGAVTVTVTGLPAGVTADPLTIGEGTDTGSLVLRSTAAAALGSSAMATVTGDGAGTMKTAMVQVFVQGPHGALDTTFNTTGKLIIPMGSATANDGAYGVTILQNGNIIVVGGGTNNSVNFAGAAAVTPAGALDTTMFVGGKHIGAYTAGTSTADLFFAATMQPDGKFLAAGYAGVLGQSHFFLVARFTAQGVLDNTFNSTGYNVTDFNTGLGDDAKAYAVTLKPDGSIVLGGFYCGATCYGASARYSSTGTFAGQFPQPPSGAQEGLFARPDGTVVAVGVQGSPGRQVSVTRYTAGDTLDTSFGNGTGATTAVLRNSGDDWANTVNALSDGRFYVGAATKNGTNYEATVARFTEAGTLDTTFAGGTGYVSTPTNNALFDRATATALQADGSIILAYTLTNTNNDFAWVRVRADGTIDPVPGVVSTDFGTGADFARAVAIQPDGRIVIVGTANANGRNNFGVARYWP